jgi:PKHD-type hydroxylase
MEPNPATAVTCLPFLPPDECEAALARLDAATWKEGRVALPGGVAEHAELRRCQLADAAADPLVTRLQTWLLGLNRALFEFELTGHDLTADPPAAMRYAPGDHFDWHIDNATLATSTRKLSYTLQLTDPADYDGGDLELALYARGLGGVVGDDAYRDQIRQRGHVTIFPAFHLHRVTPVTRGARVALVGWLHGPRFR